MNHILGYCELLLEEAGERSLQQWTPRLLQIHSAGTRLLVLTRGLRLPILFDVSPCLPICVICAICG